MREVFYLALKENPGVKIGIIVDFDEEAIDRIQYMHYFNGGPQNSLSTVTDQERFSKQEESQIGMLIGQIEKLDDEDFLDFAMKSAESDETIIFEL